MINRVVDLIVKDIRKECDSHKICTNKCPYAEFCEEYYDDLNEQFFSKETLFSAGYVIYSVRF